MLLSPKANLNSSSTDDPADSLLFYLSSPILTFSDPISQQPRNEQHFQHQQPSDLRLFNHGRLSDILPRIPPATKLRGQECASLSLDIQQGANRPPDINNQPDHLAEQYDLASHNDPNQELLSLLLNPELYPSQPADTPDTIYNSFTSPEINLPLRFNDIIFDDSASWSWTDPTLELTMNSSLDSCNDFLSPTTNLFDVQASPSLSLAASLFNSEVFESPLQQHYLTPDSDQLSNFISNFNSSIPPNTLPSPAPTPAFCFENALMNDICSTSPFAFPPVDVNSFDLFPSLDEVMLPHGNEQQFVENQPQIDPALVSALSDIVQHHQQALASANLTPEQMVSLVQALATISPTAEADDCSSTSGKSINASQPATSVTTSESISGGAIRHTPATVRRRRVTKMYACNHPGCDKAFSRHFNLKAHQKTHDPNRERPFTCEICSKSFIRAHDLMRHQPVHTKVKEFECEVCQKRFTRKDAKDRHMLLGKCK